MDIIVPDILKYIFFALYLYVIVSIIILIILENRNPAKTLIWILVLTFLPILGVIFYAFLGQDFRRRKIISKKSIHRLNRHPIFDFFALNEKKTYSIPDNIQKIIKLLSTNSEAPVYGNNKIDIYTNGADVFDAMFADIERAQNHIHVEFYIVENDSMGLRLRDSLIAKAREGVRVRFIYDYLGSFSLNKDFLRPLYDSGVYVQSFLPVYPYLGVGKINYRNHRKLLIVDGRIGYTGGMNIANRYVYGNKLGIWRDTQIRLEGTAVHGLQNAFLVDWYFVDRKLITDAKYYPQPDIFDAENLVQIVSSGPDTDWQNILQGIVAMIQSARQYFYIHTPYFLPPEPVLSALQIAALSGVDIRLIIPEKSDTRMVQMATKSYIKQMLEAGVRVFFYQGAFLHSKAIVMDDAVSTVGTSNMDFRSYEQNFEINAFIYEKKTAVSLRKAFENDLKKCREITLEEWAKRKKKERLKDSIARLFSPLL